MLRPPPTRLELRQEDMRELSLMRQRKREEEQRAAALAALGGGAGAGSAGVGAGAGSFTPGSKLTVASRIGLAQGRGPSG